MRVGKNSQKITEGRPTPDDAGALIFQNLRRGSGKVGENTKRHYLIVFQSRDPSLQRIIHCLEFLYRTYSQYK